MDKLKEYLNQHAGELDIDSPGDEVWQRIRSKAHSRSTSRKMARLVTVYLAAACILVLIGVGIRLIIKENGDVIKPADVVKNRLTVTGDSLLIREKNNETAKQDDITNVNPPVANNRVTPARKKVKALLHNQANDEAVMIGQGYSQLINLQLRRLRTTPVYAESPGYFTDFKIQLKQMDKDEEAIRSDVKVYGLNDQLLEQLINVYQQKLNVLKSLQMEINKMNNRIKEKEQPSDKRIAYYLNI